MSALDLGRRVAEGLLGTNGTTADGVMDGMGIPAEGRSMTIYTEVDAEVFCCETCGWWYDRGEESSADGFNGHCDKCEPENDG